MMNGLSRMISHWKQSKSQTTWDYPMMFPVQTAEEIAAETAAAFKWEEDRQNAETAAAYQQYYDELEQKRCDNGYYDTDDLVEDDYEPTELNVGGHPGSLLIFE